MTAFGIFMLVVGLALLFLGLSLLLKAEQDEREDRWRRRGIEQHKLGRRP